MEIIEIPDLFNNEVCDLYIDKINNHDRKISFSSTTMFESNKFYNKNISSFIFNKLKYKVKVNKLNPLVLTAKYNPGEQSHLHLDPPFDDEVKYTLLIYLNDNFEGGETKFYDDDFKLIKIVSPKKGKGLLFDINLFHQGTTVVSGNKYWIGCQLS